jgi:hypothetical protein
MGAQSPARKQLNGKMYRGEFVGLLDGNTPIVEEVGLLMGGG